MYEPKINCQESWMDCSILFNLKMFLNSTVATFRSATLAPIEEAGWVTIYSMVGGSKPFFVCNIFHLWNIPGLHGTKLLMASIRWLTSAAGMFKVVSMVNVVEVIVNL